MNKPRTQFNIWYKLKFALIFFLPFAVLINSFLWLFFHRDITAMQKDIKKHAVTIVDMQRLKIGSDFKLIASDLLFFANYTQLLDMLDQPESTSDLLIDDLVLFSRGSRIFDQIRVVDITGLEMVRINLQDNKPVVVKGEQLQFKGGRYYFLDTIKLYKNEVFVSPFDLNIEHGKIELPIKPMIRFGTPIFDREGRSRGAVIFNYLGINLLREIKNIHFDSPGFPMLCNDDGYWIVGMKKEDEWGFMYEDKKDRTMGNMFPEAWEKISSTETGQFNSKYGLFTFSTIYPILEGWKSSPGTGDSLEDSESIIEAKKYNWKIISYIPNNYFIEGDNKVLGRYVYICIMISIILAIISWIWASVKLRQKIAIVQLDDKTEQLSMSNEQLQVEISDRKQVQEQLKANEIELLAIYDNVPLAIFIIDQERRVYKSNRTANMFAEQTFDDVKGLRLGEILRCIYFLESSGGCRSSEHCIECTIRQIVQDTFETGKSHYNVEAVHQFAQSKENAVFLISTVLLRTPEDQRVLICIEDITTQKKAKEDLEKYRQNLESLVNERTAELKVSENRFAKVFNSSPDAIIIAKLSDGCLLHVNESFGKMFKFSNETCLGKTSLELGLWADPAAMEKVITPLLGGQAIRDVEVKAQQSSGKIFDISLSCDTIHIEEETCSIFIARDISLRKKNEMEKKKLEGYLRQTQKMEAMGSLAGGIAHDFNNILSAVLGYAELVKEDLPTGSTAINMQEQVIKAGIRAKKLVEQILLFSRQTEQEVKPIQPHLIIKEAIKLLRSSIPTTIEIKQDVPSNLGSIIADPTHIHQIIMNLCTNSSHAMRQVKGVLAVKLSKVTISNDDITFTDLSLNPGTFLLLEVSDTGHGMDQVIVDKIFNPYFTTKPKGEGTGLGLSVVHGIVKSYNGCIKVYSEPDQGTNVSIYFPKVTNSDDNLDIQTESELSKGNEHILIVDDDKAILDMLSVSLKSLGYQVTSFTNSMEAFNSFQAEPDSYDLVITDMTMPHMTGLDLTKQLFEIEPDISIILCTGYSELISRDKANALGIKDFLLKPVLRKDLSETIRKVLDNGS